MKTLLGQSRKEIEKNLQRAKDGNIYRKPLETRFCKDCGEKGHYKGDTKCKSPSRHTLKMREKTRKKQDRDDEHQVQDEPKKGRFLSRLQTQRSLTAGSGAASDVSPSSIDPSRILDTGYPRSIGGIRSALALWEALDIRFELENLDCEPFYHGYGMNCSKAKITIGVWRLLCLKANILTHRRGST